MTHSISIRRSSWPAFLIATGLTLWAAGCAGSPRSLFSNGWGPSEADAYAAPGIAVLADWTDDAGRAVIQAGHDVGKAAGNQSNWLAGIGSKKTASQPTLDPFLAGRQDASITTAANNGSAAQADANPRSRPWESTRQTFDAPAIEPRLDDPLKPREPFDAATIDASAVSPAELRAQLERKPGRVETRSTADVADAEEPANLKTTRRQIDLQLQTALRMIDLGDLDGAYRIARKTAADADFAGIAYARNEFSPDKLLGLLQEELGIEAEVALDDRTVDSMSDLFVQPPPEPPLSRAPSEGSNPGDLQDTDDFAVAKHSAGESHAEPTDPAPSTSTASAIVSKPEWPPEQAPAPPAEKRQQIAERSDAQVREEQGTPVARSVETAVSDSSSAEETNVAPTLPRVTANVGTVVNISHDQAAKNDGKSSSAGNKPLQVAQPVPFATVEVKADPSESNEAASEADAKVAAVDNRQIDEQPDTSGTNDEPFALEGSPRATKPAQGDSGMSSLAVRLGIAAIILYVVGLVIWKIFRRPAEPVQLRIAEPADEPPRQERPRRRVSAAAISQFDAADGL